MERNVVVHVFSALQNLERYFEEVKKLLPRDDENSLEMLESLPQHAQILKNMRRVANKLQLEVAREDWNSVVRSLKIFYGLHFLVRPELVSALVRLTKDRAEITEAPAMSVYH